MEDCEAGEKSGLLLNSINALIFVFVSVPLRFIILGKNGVIS